MISASTPLVPRSPVRRAWVPVWLAVFVVLVPLLSACTSGTPGSGPLRLAVSGRAVVEDPSGDQIVVEGARRLELGSVVQMVSGRATLEYPDDITLELRAGVGRADHTTLLAAPTPELRGGDVLVVESVDATVEADGAEVNMTGTGKVARRLALLTQIYTGEGVVTSGGRSVDVPALRQASVPAARLVPASPSPLAYDPSDPWDRRYLGEAVALGDELLTRARGFTAQLGESEGRTPGFYRLLLPDLEAQPGFDGSLIDRDRPPGETLVGAAIAVAATDDEIVDRAAFRDRWTSVFAFREAGAHWGLVALDHAVERDPLVDRLDAAIGRAPLSDVAISAPGGSGGPPTLLPPSGSPSPEGPAPPPPDDGDEGGNGDGDDDDDPVPPPPDPNDAVDEILDGLLGDDTSSDPPAESSDGSTTDTTDDSGGLLGGLLGSAAGTVEETGELLGG